MTVVADEISDLKARLRDDWPFYARECLKIVNKSGDLVPFIPKEPQMRFWAKLKAQHDAGKPMRGIVLKARQIGFSTEIQGIFNQRVCQRSNHRALVVAQDTQTAGELFEKNEIMHANLPADPELGLKPPIRNRRERRSLFFGEPSRQKREQGLLGINSLLRIDTAQEVVAGRGLTYHSMHLTEVAQWPDPQKLHGLLEAVPDEWGTLIVQESTARGYNHFRKTWLAALRGSAWIAHFEPWFNEPDYVRPFLDPDDRQRFIEEEFGTGEFGEGEEELLELIRAQCTLVDVDPYEQLHWRRHKIDNPPFEGDVRTFMQEYPATWREAFLSSGQTVFSPITIDRVVRETEETPPIEVGRFEYETEDIMTVYGTVARPVNPVWRPERTSARTEGTWRVWEHPTGPKDPETGENRSPGQYVLAMDPAGGEPMEPDQAARHGLVVIDHRTGEQVAEYVSQADPDLVAIDAYAAALYFNQAWLVVEVTGGYGLSTARRWKRAYHYPFVYKPRQHTKPGEQQRDQMGWRTTPETKPMMEDLAKELLRTDSHGIRSNALALEMNTYVRDERGRTGPEQGEFADRLLAWMIGQMVRQVKPLRTDRKPGEVTSTWSRKIRSRKTGY